MSKPSAPQLVFSETLQPGGKVATFANDQSRIEQTDVPGNYAAGITLETWVKPSAVAATDVVLSFGLGTVFLTLSDPANLTVKFNSSSVSTGVALSVGRWAHVALALAPGPTGTLSIRFVVDTREVYYGAGALSLDGADPPGTGDELTLGLRDGETGTALKGSYSETRAWPRALSSAEIGTNAFRRLTAAAGGPSLVWSLTSAPPDTTANQVAYDDGDLTFRGDTLTASWTAAGQDTYNLRAYGVDYSWSQILSPAVSPQSLTGYLIGTPAAAILQSVVDGTASEWSDVAHGAVLRLAQPALRLNGTVTGASASLQLEWDAIDQAASYAVQVNETGQPASAPVSVTSTTYSLTDKLGASSAYQVEAGAVSGISHGPVTAPASLATPVPVLLYDDHGATPSLTLSWPAVPGAAKIYISWAATGGATPPAAQFVDGSTTSLPPITTDLVRDVTYTASVQAIATGGLSVTGMAAASTAVVSAPTHLKAVTEPKVGATSGKVTLSWQFSDPAHPNPTFEAAIYNHSGAKVGSQTTTTTSCEITSSEFEPTAEFTAKVQVRSPTIIGPEASMSVFIVPVPIQFNISYNAMNSNLTASWNAVSVPAAASAGKNVVYTLRIQGPLTGSNCDSVPASPTVDFSKTVSGETVTLSKSDVPHLADNQDYGATVTASVETSAGRASACDSMHTQPYVPPANPPDSPSTGDPVGIASGNFTHYETDLTINGLIPLHFTLYYNSSLPLPADGPLGVSTVGARWRHAYDSKIVSDDANGKLYVVWGTTDIAVYNKPANNAGRYTPYGPFNGDDLLVEGSGYRLIRKDQTVWHFGADGAPTSVDDRYGNTLAFTYTSGNLSRVALTGSGNWIQFGYQGSTVHTVTGSDGRSLTLTVTSGGLTSVLTAQGGTRAFAYSDSSKFLLSQVTDEWGNVVVHNIYDSNERVHQQYDGVGYAESPKYFTTFAYGQTTYQGQTFNTTQVTTPENEVSLYYSDPDSKLITYSQVDISQGSPVADLVEIKTTTYNGFHVPETQTVYRGALSAYQTGRGNSATTSYDSNLNRSAFENAGGRQQSWVYDLANNLVSSTDANGNPTARTYKSGNRLHQIVDALGETVTLEYWAVGGSQPFKGLVKTATDPYGNVTQYDYDPTTGLVKTETRPNQDTIAYTYDSSGRVKTETEASGGVAQRILKYDYNNLDRLTNVTIRMGEVQLEADAFVYHWAYDTPVVNTIVKTDPNGNAITTTLNANRAPTVTAYPEFDGVTVSRTRFYDKDGRLSGTSRGSKPATQIGYNGLDERVTYTDQRGAVTTSYAMQDIGAGGSGPYPLVQTQILPQIADGSDNYTYTRTTTIGSDGRAQSIAETYKKSGIAAPVWARTRSFEYAVTARTHGNITSYDLAVTQTTTPVAPAGTAITETSVSDGLYRPLSSTDAAQAVTHISYAQAAMPGNPGLKVMCATATPPVGAPQLSYIDSLGRLVAESAGSAAEATAKLYDLDVLNRPTRVRVGDTLQKLAAGDFSAPGAADMTHAFTYEKVGGHPRLRIDTSQPTTSGDTIALSKVFDALSRPVSESFFGGKTRARTFAPWGAVATRTLPDNRVTTYAFDASGYQVGVTLPTTPPTAITQTLDDAGNRDQTKVNGTVTITRTFDAWNRESSRTSNDSTVTASYWPNDRMRKLVYPDGKTVQYALDGFGQWHTITDWSDRVTTYAYRPTGEVNTVTYPNGVVSTFGYNDAGAITTVSHIGPGHTQLADLTITPNSHNRPATVAGIWPAPVTLPVSATAIGITDNEATSFDGTALTSDHDGNMSEAPVPGGGIQALGYDPTGKLTSAGAVTFGYDADGLLEQRSEDNVTETYVVQPNFYQDPILNLASGKRRTIAAKLAPSGTAGLVFDAVRGSDNRAGCLCMDLDWRLQAASGGSVKTHYVHGLGPVIADDTESGVSYLHSDHAGNIILTTDTDGNPVTQTIYAPFGAPRGGTAAPTFGFAGRFGVISEPQGLLMMRARAYSPGLMRFTGMDLLAGDITRPTERHRYQYGLNQPGVYADPLGLSKVPLIIGGTILGGAVLGGLGVACYFFCSAAAGAIGGFFSGVGSAIGGFFGGVGSAISGLFEAGETALVEGEADALLGEEIEMDEFGDGGDSGSEGEGSESGDESDGFGDETLETDSLLGRGYRQTGPNTWEGSSGNTLTRRAGSSATGIPRY